MVEIILLTVVTICIAYKTFHKEPAFDVDETCWFKVRDKILKEDYAGVYYSMATSLSPVVIKHRNPLPLDKRHAIQKLFPSWLRIEFQEVEWEGERTETYGRGNMLPLEAVNLLWTILQDEVTQRQSREYLKDKNGNWIEAKK